MRPIKIKLSKGYIAEFHEAERDFLTYHRGSETYQIDYTPGAEVLLLHNNVQRVGPGIQQTQQFSREESLPVLQALLKDLFEHQVEAELGEV